MIGKGDWTHMIQALRYRDHRLFCTTLSPALLSLWAQRTGVGWLAWDLTHSPTWLGVIAAADLLPGVILSPFAGVTADRAVPLKLLRLAQSIIVVQALALCVLTATGLITIWILFGLCLLLGLNYPYFTAARMVLYPVLVPKAQLRTAIAINSTLFNAGRAVGPALAGVMIGPLGVASVFLFNFATFSVHMVTLFRIHPVREERRAPRAHGMIPEILEGLRYAVRHPGIGPFLLLLTVSTVASRPLTQMLPGFADEVFRRGPEGLGWMLGAVGLGGLTGAVWLTRRGPAERLTSLVLTTILLMGLAMIAVAFIGNFWLALAFLVVLGFAYTVSGTGTESLLQTAVAPEVRGRVMSLYSVIFRSMPAIGAIVIGVFADLLSLSLAVAGAACVCLLAWAAAMPRRHALAAALEVSLKRS